MSKDPKSKRSAVRSALKGVWKEKDKQKLEKRLDKCRSQLELRMSYILKSVWTLSIIHRAGMPSLVLATLVSYLRVSLVVFYPPPAEATFDLLNILIVADEIHHRDIGCIHFVSIVRLRIGCSTII
jgi:hypothetical protein